MINQQKVITQCEAKEFLLLYKGQTVTHVFRGAGSALIMDIGSLSITIEWSWRLETESNIEIGSWSNEDEINKVPEIINNLSVKGITFFGRLSEIVIEFSNGYWLSSFATAEGNPEWAIKYQDTNYMFYKDGQYLIEL
jgi:hypothetical protein